MFATVSDLRQENEIADLHGHYSVVFRTAVEKTLANEGSLVDDPSDPGGLTKFGISQRQYPELDIARLTRDQAIALYFRDWWQRFGYEELPPPIASKLFDLAINIGPRDAVRCLQRALKACSIDEIEDGVLGPATRQSVHLVRAEELLPALRSEAAGHYRLIAATRHDNHASAFLKGWLRRAYE